MQLRTVPAGVGESAEVDLCELCGGVFIEFFDGEPSSVALGVQALVHEEPIAPSRAWPERADCPDCSVPMRGMRYMDGEEGPPVFRCGGCMALFVGQGQLGELAAYADKLFETQEE